MSTGAIAFRGNRSEHDAVSTSWVFRGRPGGRGGNPLRMGVVMSPIDDFFFGMVVTAIGVCLLALCVWIVGKWWY